MFIRFLFAVSIAVSCVPFVHGQTPKKAKRPNVIVIMTDDQGFGDLSCHGNPVIKTPHIDRFAKKGIRMRNFHVSPVCAPTRASLMTGRYNYRTGVVDTFIGRAMMHPDEITLAEILRALGYRTGIFGKWHLGDNYPLRAIDQGFTESLVLKGGGIGQPSDPPGGESYFNPILLHNGKAVKKDGYISDILTDAAIDFIKKSRDGPFLCYLPFNCPHTPLQVPDKYYRMYKDQIKAGDFPKVGFPIQGKVNLDETAKIYGMITNIDDNVDRLFAVLDKLGIADDTIIIFLSDNGPQQPRFVFGLRGRKGTVFEGGTRVPFFVSWPAGFKGDRDIDRVAAHIDITPTIVEVCGGTLPKDRKIDGKSLLPLWKGQQVAWPERTLFFQWHRGDVPQMYRAFAARSQRYRLVQPVGVGENSKFDRNKVLLFDIENDPHERNDLAVQKPDVVAKLKKEYETWFKDVASTRGFAPPRIVVGSEEENPTVLTRQDWRGPQAGWTPKSIGHWLIQVDQAGRYDVEVTLLKPAGNQASVRLLIGQKMFSSKAMPNQKAVLFRGMDLIAGPIQVEARIVDGATSAGARYVQIGKIK